MPEGLGVDPGTRIRRLPERQVTDREVLYDILDRAVVAHVAVVRDGLPVVIPFACARDGDTVLLHGSTGSGLMRACASGAPVAVGITLLDGLVVSRSVFDNSMNYRSVVVFGVPEVLEGDAKEQALHHIVEYLLPGRSGEVRPTNRKEYAATLVLRLPLDRVSVKVRTGQAVTEPDGEDPSVWAGVVPLSTWAGDPVPDDDVTVEVPASVRAAVRKHRGWATRR
jgi:uncharacterized protein